MPFVSLKQELYLKKNQPKVWREWVAKYGHHPEYASAVKRAARKGAKTRAKRKVKGGRR